MAEIGRGLCVLLGVASDDDEAVAERLAGKVARLRIFENDEGKFDRSVVDVHGSTLVVSQFTLIADSKRRGELDRASPTRPARSCRTAVRGLLRNPPRLRAPRRNRCVRRPHGRRARRRRPRHAHFGQLGPRSPVSPVRGKARPPGRAFRSERPGWSKCLDAGKRTKIETACRRGCRSRKREAAQRAASLSERRLASDAG